jgi:hypothetical protein
MNLPEGGIQMKTEIPLLPAVIAAVIYACGLFMLFSYVVQSLAMVTIEADHIAEGLAMLP